MVKAHHIWPTWRPILHIAQVRLLIKLHMPTTIRQAGRSPETCAFTRHPRKCSGLLHFCLHYAMHKTREEYALANLSHQPQCEAKQNGVYLHQRI